ncbi:nucleoside-diphosphate kinase [candidate division Kazan bacterium]|uniref:nucleoside-diphosphate kinase n=1 Tax=candidate division Kazan bacterium TaxID=2202143 RepID=A0A420ZDE4_UNCK3|nr:MAG: nucleoside-diphosphate kinase [candidate division Kazan bacterium]
MERSFVMLKPDALKRGLADKIIKRFTDAGLSITAQKKMTASQEIVEQHYPIDDEDYVIGLGHKDTSNLSETEKTEIYDKNMFIIKAMHKFMRSGPVIAMIIEGPKGTIKKIREIVGKTNPPEAAPGTIRGDFGEDSYEQADKEGRSVHNLVHASGTSAEAEREIKLWFPELAQK